MKKRITLLLAVSLVLSLTACGGGGGGSPAASEAPDSASTGHTHTEEIIPAVEPDCTETGLTEGKRCSECGEILVEQEAVPALGHTTDSRTCERCGQSLGIWYTDYYVDEFNQPIADQWYIANNTLFVGTFNNSATSDSGLTAELLVDFEDYISIFLYEYRNNLVKNASENYVDEYNIIMRTPDGTDHHITGTMFCGGDRVVIDEGYNDEVLTALKGEGNIGFYIENAERTVENYLITVPASNFAEEFAAAAEK